MMERNTWHTPEHFRTVQFVCASRRDKSDAACPHVGWDGPVRNELVLLGLCTHKLVHERIPSEVVQGVLIPRRACRLDGEHVQPRRVTLRECKRLRLELTAWIHV